MGLQGMKRTAGVCTPRFGLIERSEKHGKESHIIAERKPANLTIPFPQRMTDAAVERTVTLFLFFTENGKNRNDISEHAEFLQAS